MAAFRVEEPLKWRRLGTEAEAWERPCKNYVEEHICNWMLPVESSEEYCVACRLTRIIPALHKPENRQYWYKLELAKRRVIHALLTLQLPLKSRWEDPQEGLAFEFLEETSPDQKILTGHAEGVITLNVAEADDVKREQARTAMHEPYRTLVGHFRHEIGHYYWDVLIRDSDWIDEFRALFGDERADYAEAVKRHYEKGPPPDWDGRFISAYATMHPWEDWAESWAHYLHMMDALQTAEHWGFTLQPLPSHEAPVDFVDLRRRAVDFDGLVYAQWLPLTRFLNSLNRSLGQPDAYPFTISAPAVEKLRFVDRVVHERIPAQALAEQ